MSIKILARLLIFSSNHLGLKVAVKKLDDDHYQIPSLESKGATDVEVYMMATQAIKVDPSWVDIRRGSFYFNVNELHLSYICTVSDRINLEGLEWLEHNEFTSNKLSSFDKHLIAKGLS